MCIFKIKLSSILFSFGFIIADQNQKKIKKKIIIVL